MARKKLTAEEVQADQREKLTRLDETIAQRVEQLVTGDDWLNAMRFAAKFRTRSFLNTLAIYFQHQAAFAEGRVPEPTPTLVAGYADWRRLGRWPAKGQHGYMIRQPVFDRYASANPDSGKWRLLNYKEQPRPGEVVRQVIGRTKPGYVWDVSQTEGQDIPERPRPVLLEGTIPPGIWDGLAALVAEAGFELRDVPDELALDGASGLTDYSNRTVDITMNKSEAARFSLLAHELGHILMHDPEMQAREPHRGIREVEAESFATMICAAYDIDALESAVPYVAGWAWSVEGKDSGEVIRATGTKVVKLATNTIDRLPAPPGGNGKPDIPREPAAEKAAPKRRPRSAAAAKAPEPEAVSL